jgi:iron complex outermembrane receptor protein
VDPPAEFSTTTSLNPLLEPSRSLTAEVGARGSLSGGGFITRLGYDVARYTLEVRNEIVPWDGGATYLTAGKSRRSGFELGLTADFAAGFSGRITGTLTRNRYVDYRTNVPDGADGMMEVTYDDNESAGIPSLALQGALRYTAPCGAYLEFAAQHMGAYWANDANTDRVEAYTVFDATAGMNVRVFGHESLLFVSGRNLADDLYVASAYINGASGRYLEPGMGRNYLAGLSLHAW